MEKISLSAFFPAYNDQHTIESIVRTTRILQSVFSGLVLNVAAAKIGFEGGNMNATAGREFAA